MRGSQCAIDWCEKPVGQRIWCVTHYNRWLTHGDAEWTPSIRTEEVVAEIEWLKGGGMSAPMIADALGTTVANLARRMNRNDRNDLAEFFRRDLKNEPERKSWLKTG